MKSTQIIVEYDHALNIGALKAALDAFTTTYPNPTDEPRDIFIEQYPDGRPYGFRVTTKEEA